MRKNVEDLKHTFDSLYDELKNKEIRHYTRDGYKPMFFIAKAKMYLGFYDRNQSKIVKELRARKVRKLELDKEQISPYFDRIHWEMAIVALTQLLKRIDEKTDTKGRIYANSSYFLEYVRDSAAHLGEAFRDIMGKTPYQDLLVLINGSAKEKEERKAKEEKMHEYLVKAYHNNFDNTKYKRENPFECEVKNRVNNVQVNPNIPKKAKIVKEVVGVMVPLFGEEEVEITVKKRVPDDKKRKN